MRFIMDTFDHHIALVITKNQPTTARGQIGSLTLKKCVHWGKPYFQMSSVSCLCDTMYSMSRYCELPSNVLSFVTWHKMSTAIFMVIPRTRNP